MNSLETFIRTIPDFPKPGILFRDITPLLADAAAFQAACAAMVEGIDLNEIELIAGIEARGFIFASALAAQYQKGVLPIRKAGKLPGDVVAEVYSLEYGEAKIEVAPGRGKVLLVDDVLATGGTLSAAIRLLERGGYTISDVSVLIELQELHQLTFKEKKIHSVLQY